MADEETRIAVRRAFYSRLRWLWPILASPLLRRTLRFALWGAFIAWVVFAVLVLALRYVVLPNVGMYHGQIEQALSRAIGQPVTIGAIEARWQGLNPDLVLDNVAIADRQGKPAFSLEQVETVLSWQSLWRGRVTSTARPGSCRGWSAPAARSTCSSPRARSTRTRRCASVSRPT